MIISRKIVLFPIFYLAIMMGFRTFARVLCITGYYEKETNYHGTDDADFIAHHCL